MLITAMITSVWYLLPNRFAIGKIIATGTTK